MELKRCIIKRSVYEEMLGGDRFYTILLFIHLCSSSCAMVTLYLCIFLQYVIVGGEDVGWRPFFSAFFLDSSIWHPPSCDCMQLKPKDYFRAPAKKEEEEVAS